MSLILFKQLIYDLVQVKTSISNVYFLNNHRLMSQYLCGFQSNLYVTLPHYSSLMCEYLDL